MAGGASENSLISLALAAKCLRQGDAVEKTVIMACTRDKADAQVHAAGGK